MLYQEALLLIIIKVEKGNRILELLRNMDLQTKCKIVRGKGDQKQLSTRELEILDYLSHGYSSTEIASALYLSYDTIKSYRKTLLKKFKARNTAQLVRKAFERKYLWEDKKGNSLI